MNKPTIYQEQGYKNRADYLQSLSVETGVDLLTVQSLADTLGPDEDFDGLVTALQDYVDVYNIGKCDDC